MVLLCVLTCMLRTILWIAATETNPCKQQFPFFCTEIDDEMYHNVCQVKWCSVYQIMFITIVQEIFVKYIRVYNFRVKFSCGS